MKANRSAAIAIALLVALTWSLSYVLSGQITALGQSVSVRWEADAGLSPADLLRQEGYAREDGAAQQPEATLWQESTTQVSDGGERSASTRCVTVFGDCTEVTQQSLLSGGFPARSDSESCAISEALAFALWGSRDVLGMSLTVDGKTYHVLGVFRGSKNVLFLQSEGDSDAPLSNLQLRFPDGGSREKAEAFLMRADAGGGVMLDLPLLAWAAGVVAGIPALALVLGLLWRIFSRWRQLRNYRALQISFLPWAALLLLGVLLCAGSVDMPARLIPTMWSDMEFWRRLGNGFVQNLSAWLTAVPSTRDLALWPRVIGLVLSALVSAFFVMLAVQRVEVRSYQGLVLCSLAYMSGLYLITLFLRPLGAVPFHAPMYLLPCLWLAADWMLALHENSMQEPATTPPALAEQVELMD